jgi:hypothetical protein
VHGLEDRHQVEGALEGGVRGISRMECHAIGDLGLGGVASRLFDGRLVESMPSTRAFG